MDSSRYTSKVPYLVTVIYNYVFVSRPVHRVLKRGLHLGGNVAMKFFGHLVNCLVMTVCKNNHR